MELLSRYEAAQLLGITDRHVDRLIRREGLPCIRLGRRVLIPRDELERWLRQRVEGKSHGQAR